MGFGVQKVCVLYWFYRFYVDVLFDLTGNYVLLDGWNLAFRKYVFCNGLGRFSVAVLFLLDGDLCFT